MIALMLLCGSSELNAQNKKTNTRKTTSSKSTSSKTSSPSLSKEFLTGCTLEFINCVDAADDSWMALEILLDENNKAVADLGYTTMNLTWSVTGNKLNAQSLNGNIKINLESPDGGITFKGTFSNPSATAVAYAANLSESKTKMDPKKVQKMIENGDYLCFVFFNNDDDEPWVGSACKLKFTPDDETSGDFKVSGSSKFLGYLGSLKGEYEWGENDLITTKFNSGEAKDETPYESWSNNFFQIDLGRANYPSRGMGKVYLDVIKKF